MENLRRICEERGWRLRRRSFALFYNFSRFMISRFDLRGISTGQLLERVTNVEEARKALEEGLREGRGAVVATAHLGNWEMGVRLLHLSGRPVHVVMMADGDEAVERDYQRLRTMEGVRVHWLGDSAYVGAELLAALRRGELVAVQADRRPGDEGVSLPLFGAPVRLPHGPAALARAAQAPILPCFVFMEEGRKLRARVEPPIWVERGSDARADVHAATLRLASAIERAVSHRPEQWFNFYPIWEQGASPA